MLSVSRAWLDLAKFRGPEHQLVRLRAARGSLRSSLRSRRRRSQSNLRSRGRRGYIQRHLFRSPSQNQSGREMLNAFPLPAGAGLGVAVHQAAHQILIEDRDMILIRSFDSVCLGICLGHAFRPLLAINVLGFGLCCQAGFSLPASRGFRHSNTERSRRLARAHGLEDFEEPGLRRWRPVSALRSLGFGAASVVAPRAAPEPRARRRNFTPPAWRAASARSADSCDGRKPRPRASRPLRPGRRRSSPWRRNRGE